MMNLCALKAQIVEVSVVDSCTMLLLVYVRALFKVAILSAPSYFRGS